jgi:hypothetical protein
MRTVCKDGRSFNVPPIGMKIANRDHGYIGRVKTVTNLKYQDPKTIQVVFVGADNETYSRPLADFWEHWQLAESKFCIFTYDVNGQSLWMERDISGRVQWRYNRKHATRFSEEEADKRIALLRDAGACGSYHKSPCDL